MEGRRRRRERERREKREERRESIPCNGIRTQRKEIVLARLKINLRAGEERERNNSKTPEYFGTGRKSF